MRLDKYLKTSRIIKRRSVAKDVADIWRIQVNGRTAKSSTDVNIGDEITIEFASNTLKVRVIGVQDTTKKNESENMYEVI